MALVKLSEAIPKGHKLVGQTIAYYDNRPVVVIEVKSHRALIQDNETGAQQHVGVSGILVHTQNVQTMPSDELEEQLEAQQEAPKDQMNPELAPEDDSRKK